MKTNFKIGLLIIFIIALAVGYFSCVAFSIYALLTYSSYQEISLLVIFPLLIFCHFLITLFTLLFCLMSATFSWCLDLDNKLSFGQHFIEKINKSTILDMLFFSWI